MLKTNTAKGLLNFNKILTLIILTSLILVLFLSKISSLTFKIKNYDNRIYRSTG